MGKMLTDVTKGRPLSGRGCSDGNICFRCDSRLTGAVVYRCHRLNCDNCLGGIMGSVLMCILMWISISNIIFYVTCFKGSITSKATLLWNILDTMESYAGKNGCVDN